MPTTDERREVAARLREKHYERQGIFEPQCIEIQASNRLYALLDCLPERRDMFLVLADLIEPEPERTCQMELCDTGEWFTPECREKYLLCSNCKFVGYFVQVSEDADYWCAKPNFCPNCGARVKED